MFSWGERQHVQDNEYLYKGFPCGYGWHRCAAEPENCVYAPYSSNYGKLILQIARIQPTWTMYGSIFLPHFME